MESNTLEFWNYIAEEYQRRGDTRDNPFEYPIIAKHCLYSILEFGPAYGMLYKYLDEEIKKQYIGVEISPVMVEKSKKYNPDANVIVGDILDSGFANGSFDTVIALQLLEHFSEDDMHKALNEMRRISARRFIFSVPNRNMIPDGSHVLMFNYEKVYEMLKDWGNVTFLPCQTHHILVMQDHE